MKTVDRILKTGLAISLLCFQVNAAPAFAVDDGELPTGGTITAGSGDISQSGSSMTVNQYTDQMIADWNTFNIGQDASLQFIQPDMSSVALNRIFDQNPTQISGSFSANGQIFLLNSAGIIFGPSAQVNVGGLVASSLNISDENFLSGNYAFETNGSAGSIRNSGTIMADGGVVALIAPQVINDGTIQAKNGTVGLFAADKVTLDFTGDGLLNYVVDEGTVDALAANNGLIKADGGLVVMTAKSADALTGAVVNADGILEAKGVSEQGGRIILDAGEYGQTTISGTVDVSSDESTGGKIVATGDRVLIEERAQLLAQGATGGGEIYVGGGWQGSDPNIREATGVAVLDGALLDASATGNGDGGTIVAWSDVNDPDSVTRVYGTLLAKGGINGGNGGQIETSGHWLDVTGVQGSASAYVGNNGFWLFDPYDVEIAAADANGTWAGGDPDVFTPSTSSSTIDAATLVGKLDVGTSVTVKTYNAGGGENGDITLSSAISKTAGGDTTLTLQAANTIVINANISSTTGALNVDLLADSNNGTHDGNGIILLNGDLTTNGGYVNFGDGSTMTVNGVANTLVGGDVYVAGSGVRSISTGGGAVNVKGEMLVANPNGLSVTTSGGNVRFYGLLNSGNSYSYDGTEGQWDDALAAAKSGTGAAEDDTYLATITSRLENAVVSRKANYQTSWLGGMRGTTDGVTTTLDAYWRWVSGPEGLANNGDGTVFYYQTGPGSGTAYGYTNWNPGEPNNCSTTSCTNYNFTASNGEQALQFTNSSGVWNDEPNGIDRISTNSYGYNVETNLAASPVTINASTGSVTFSGEVGTNKALDLLNVTASTIAVDGGAVTTEGLQTYTGDVTLGSASTTLTQTNADTDFTVVSEKLITNAYGSDADLTIKTKGNIILDTSSSIVSTTGQLDTVLWSDSDATNGGYIHIRNGSTIKTNGGAISLGGGTDGNGYAEGTSAQTEDPPHQDGISIYHSTLDSRVYITGTPQSSGGGTITLKGKGYAGNLDMHGGGLWTQAGSINTGGGDLVMDVQAQENGGATEGGIRYGAFFDATPMNTSGGNIQISTASPNSTWTGLYINASATISAGAGNISLLTDQISVGEMISGTGTLTIQPLTADTTIGLAGGSGDLNINATEWGYIQNGFSSITIGNDTAGLITVGNSALPYYDPLTLKTNNSIFFSSSSALTGNGNALTLWTRAAGNDAATDANEGSVWLPVGSSITTGGGDVTIGGGSDPTVGYAFGDDAASSDEHNARYRGVTINGGINAGGGDIVINGRGNAGAAAKGVSIGNTIQTSGSGTITIRGIAKGASSGITLGDTWFDPDRDGVLQAENGTITLQGEKDTGDAIELATADSYIKTTGTGNVVLTATSGDIEGATGYVVSGGTTTLTAATSDDITLTNVSNDFTGAVSVVSGNDVSIIDSNAMTLGAVDSTLGAIDIATLTGDLTLTGAVDTTNTGTSAIKLNAGKSTAAGTSTGGNIIVSGGSLSTGSGGRSILYSGSVSNSTGLTALIGSGSGDFRYNSDESASNFSTALSSGNYAIYREQSTVTVTAADDDQTYSGVAYSGGNGVTVSGLQNGDTSGILTGTLAYGGNSQGAVNAGSHAITPSGYSNGLGYVLSYTNGALTISKAPLTVTANDDSKTYNGSAYSGGNGVGYSGFVNSETSSVLGGALAYGGTSQGAVNAGSYTITPSGLTAANYTISFVDGALAIAAAPTANTNVDTVVRSLTSLQKAINGTQETSSGGFGAESTGEQGRDYAFGPGTGSNFIDIFSLFKLVEDRR